MSVFQSNLFSHAYLATLNHFCAKPQMCEFIIHIKVIIYLTRSLKRGVKAQRL